MKKNIYLIVCLILFFIFYNKPLFAEESMLTIKQQLDRLQREVNDLSKSLFKNSNKSNANPTFNNDSQTEKFAAIDMRIYDLEKDIKILNSNLEEVVFKIDELIKLYEELSLKIDTDLINRSKDIETSEISTNEIDEIIDIVKSSDMEIFDISTDEGDLEDVFVKLTSK